MIKLDIDLTGKIVFITGAGRGLGRAMALGIVQHGGRVCALDREDGRGELEETVKAAGSMAGEDSIVPMVADITVPDDCRAAVQQARSRFGRIDVLINNAGVGMELLGTFLHNPPKFFEVPLEVWRKVVDTNINGTFYMTRAVAPLMVAHSWGRIINVTGRLFVMLRKGLSPYGSTKAAMESATAIWAADLADTGVTVNSLSPGGLVDTRMIPAEEIKDRETLLRPQIMIPPAVWLSSSRSDGTTGMRLTAKEWDVNLPPDEAAKRAGVKALVGEFPAP